MPKRRKEEESECEETSSSKKKTTTSVGLGHDAAWSDGGGNYSTTVPKLPSTDVDTNNNNNNIILDRGERGGGAGEDPEDPTDSKVVSSAIPIFLKKTYRMIDTCDPEICSWTADGEMFVVKNPVREKKRAAS